MSYGIFIKSLLYSGGFADSAQSNLPTSGLYDENLRLRMTSGTMGLSDYLVGRVGSVLQADQAPQEPNESVPYSCLLAAKALLNVQTIFFCLRGITSGG